MRGYRSSSTGRESAMLGTEALLLTRDREDWTVDIVYEWIT